MRALIASLWVAMSKPRTRPWPLVGVMIPHSMRIVVVLPEPFGPKKAKTSPSRISSDSRSTAISSPYTFVNSSALTAVVMSIERLAEAISAQPKHHQAEDRQREHLWPQYFDADALENDPAQDLQEVRERDQQPQLANRVRHALARKHEARQDDRRQHHEQRHLHGLALRLRDGRDQQPEAQRAEHKEPGQPEQQQIAPGELDAKPEPPDRAGQQDIAEGHHHKRQDLAQHQLPRLHRRDDQLFDRASFAFADHAEDRQQQRPELQY